MKPTALFQTRLREAVATPLLTPVVFNAQSAQIAERAGFKAVWLGGSTVTNSLLGLPDGGYLGLTDIEYVLRRAVDTTSISLLVDLDSGYGSFATAYRAIRTMESAGAVGGQIDDQINHMTPQPGRPIPVVPTTEAVGKIKSAVDARRDFDFLIVARTDSLWTLGVGAAVERANLFAQAGADAAFITGIDSLEAMQTVKRGTAIAHRMISRMPKGVSLAQASQLGFNIVALGQADALRASTLALIRYFERLHSGGLNAVHEFEREVQGTAVADWAGFTGLTELAQSGEQLGQTTNDR
jgi:2-methylisocitrate lyase-like PEP mutase family enzyme